MKLAPALAFSLLLAICPVTAGTLEMRIADAKGQPVPDTVVSLVPLDAPPQRPARGATAEIEQKDQEYRPYVTAVRVGTTVVFPNRDTVEHYIYSQSPAKKIALPLYKPGKSEVVVFDRPGVVVLGCNIHDPMIAYVVVLETSWFAVTPADGRAMLRDVPAGRYRADVWQPRLPKQSGVAKAETRELVIGDGGPVHVDFTLTLGPDRRIRRTPGTVDRGYR